MAFSSSKYKLTLFLGSLIWLLPSLLNGYPIIQDDSHAYLYSGMALSVPFDRPVFYGIYLLLSSLHLSLWFSVAVQCFLTFCLLDRWIKVMLKDNYRNYQSLILSILLLITPATINANQLMPDAFTPILILSFLLFWLDDEHPKKYFWLILLSGLMHNSHWLLLVGLIIISLLFYAKYFRSQIVKFKKLGIAVFSILLILFASNFTKFKSFSPSPASTFFLLGRLAESGALSNYVQKSCEKEDLKFCNYKDSLNLLVTYFLWDTSLSPLYKIGGYQQNKAELDAVVMQTLTDKSSLLIFIQNSIHQSYKQVLFNRSLLYKIESDNRIYRWIEKWFPLDNYLSKNSKQTKNNYRFALQNFINNSLLALSISLIIVVLIRSKKTTSAFMISIILATIVLNAILIGTLAGLDSRLQARVAWLIIPLAFLVILKSNKTHSPDFGGTSGGL